MYKKIAHIKYSFLKWSFLIIPLLLQVVIGTTVYAQAPSDGGNGGTQQQSAPPATQSDLENLVNNIAQFGAVGVGIVVVAMMGWAGFRYLSAGDNSSQVSEAKTQIFHALLALFLYLFALAILNWLTPGGLGGGGGGENSPGPGPGN